MRINCFRSAGGHGAELDDDHVPQAARPVAIAKKTTFRRHGSGDSTASDSSWRSNDSISKLPPCHRASDPKIEAMMMPVPIDRSPSRCLRLSHPKIYSNLVSDMKTCKGCRDWRNFAVFYTDDVDESISADEAARKRAIEYQRKLRQLDCSFKSFDSGPSSERSISVDMIG